MSRLRLPDLLAVSGFAALVGGLSRISLSLALIVAGVLLLTAGVLGYYTDQAPRRPRRRTLHAAGSHPAPAKRTDGAAG